jgi:hypothetical protein
MMEKEPTAATIFPLFSGEGVTDIQMSHLVLDGNRPNNPEQVNGSVSAAVLLKNSHRITLNEVTVQAYSGDGFSFQTCDDVVFQHCVSRDNAGFGFHPGSGAQRTIFKQCTAQGNTEGIYYCWGVTESIAEECVLSDNTHYGASLGHRDTKNRIENCTIENNGKVGILFREEANASRSAQENVLTKNTFNNNSVGIEIRGETQQTSIKGNHFTNANSGQPTAIRINPSAADTVMEDNEFVGTATEVDRSVSLRKRVKGFLKK